MNQEIIVRALFDKGSEINLITIKCVNRANLIKRNFSIELEGIIASQIVNNGITYAKLSPWFDMDEETVIFKSFVIMKQLPFAQRNDISSQSAAFNDLVKADPYFYKTGHADILLGVDTWAEIVMNDLRWNGSGLCAQQTIFGYAIFGSIQRTPSLAASISFGRIFINDDNERLDDLLQKFWIEEQPINPDEPILSEAELRAEKIYEQTTTRASDGAFIVRMPLIDGDIELGDSRKIAMERFFQLERRLKRNPEIREKYNAAMRQDIETGQMRLATQTERSAIGYYIPHHPIVKRFRIVLDGSCVTSNGKSINDIQLPGPNKQEKLEVIVMRFRFHKYVLSADIKKMFRQIKMNSEDLKYQKIFWRFNETDPLKEYVLTTVTFGMKSSPFLACNTMLKSAEIYKEKYPLASKATKDERYVDDFMSGADTIDQVVELYTQLKSMLAECNFDLGKYKTNCFHLLKIINDNLECNDQPLQLSDDETTSILGLNWHPISDCFAFKIDEKWSDDKVITKRTISSAVAKIYDPSGYLAPVVIRAKAFLQELWKSKLSWDEQLSKDISERWINFFNDLSAINEVRIPRWLQTTDGRDIQLFGFADASELGYGAVIYVRCASGSTIWSNILTSKTKIAPVKTVSIPRLELCAATLLAQTMTVVRKKCNLENVPYRCYSDSNITLAWIKSCPSTLKTYVGSRVKKIQENSSIQSWNYVASKENPADLASRGIKPSELIKCDIWWHGPSSILLETNQNTSKVNELSCEETKALRDEFKPVITAKLTIKDEIISICSIPLIDRYNRFSKIIRITAYIFKGCILLSLKFSGRTIKSSDSDSTSIGLLTPSDVVRARNYWIKYEQRRYFSKELTDTEQGFEVNRSSNLVQLCPFVDQHGILRVRGRLLNATVTYDERYPIIIPSNSRLARLLLEEAHHETLHGSIQVMLHYTRSKYWIIGARKTAASTVKSCVTCLRFSKQDHHQIMSDLPEERITSSRPFSNCGVDYFGPIKVKRFAGRCKSIDTGYGAVFVCMVTRMVHIECVTDLTAGKFLDALARLAYAYQMPSTMFCDNAKTHIGAKNILTNLVETWQSREVESFLTLRAIKFKFITPRAPNHGGLWEAAVKSAKYHLKRMILKEAFTFEQYQTLFAKISAVLNSRPLVPLTDDPTELNYLTPAHAVLGERIIHPICENLSDIPMNRIKQQKILDKIQQDFWQIWRKEYISTLQTRYKWNKTECNLKIGDMVILKEDNVPPGAWPIARVIETYPGTDDMVRTVKIRTPRNDYVRPICKLIKLPFEECINEENELPPDSSTK